MRAIFLFLAVAFPTVLEAQQPKVPPLVETAEVRLVNVDVTVSDSEGRPVAGLTQDDFEVFEDGVLQPIVGFYAVEDAAVRLIRHGETADKVDPQQLRRKLVVMIDNNTVQKPHRDAAIEFVGNFVDEQFGENYEWSVLTVGSEVETLQTFTTDKEAIRTALLKARRKPTFLQRRAIDRDLLTDPGRASLRQSSGASGYDFDQTARFQSQEQTKRNVMAAMNSARAVIQTCRAYSASTGRKALVLITGGIELNTTFGIIDDQDDRNILDMKRNLEQILNTMVREANAANFKIFIVKPGGHQSQAPQHDVANRGAGLAGSMKNPFFGEGFTIVADSSNLDSSSLTLALQTGGRFLPATNARQSLEQIDRDTANYYSLAYKPKLPEDGKYHSLRVRVKRPEMQVHHRAGYMALSPEQRLELSLRSPITFAKEKGTLPVDLEVGEVEKGEGDKRIIPIAVSLPFHKLTTIRRGEQYIGRVHVYLSIYDESGNNVGFHHRVQDVTVPAADFESTKGTAVRHHVKMGLKKGKFTIVATLRDELSDEIGTGLKDVRL